MRNKEIHFRVTEKELVLIESAAKESNMTVSEYLRAGIGSRRYKPADDESTKELTQQLSRIGNNLNQLVVIERTKGQDYSEIEKTLKEIMELKSQILKSVST